MAGIDGIFNLAGRKTSALLKMADMPEEKVRGLPDSGKTAPILHGVARNRNPWSLIFLTG